MEKKAFTVRLARPDDAWELARLLSIFDSQMLAQTQLLDRMKTIQDIEAPLLVEVEGHIVGLACLRLVPTLSTDYPHAEITELWVEKPFQGNGIESALIERLEILASERGALHLILHTGQKNFEAQALYRALGFRDYALAMRKTLSLHLAS
jgi:ribosomal protein S18 acetylase RimI-like enzyme